MKMLSLKSVKNFTAKNVFQNRIVLYVLAFIALIEILALANMKDYNSVIVFLIIGFLASFFTKNMIIILLSAIVFTSAYRRIQVGTYAEGMENTQEKPVDAETNDEETNDEEGKDEEGKDEEGKDEEGNDEEGNDIKENIENKNEKKKDDGKDLKNANEKKKVYDQLKKDFQDFQNIQKTILTNMKEIDPLLEKAENFISKFEQYKNKN
tara:strand:+ start:733 stop:1359 length:627 start_codon:yes stop_codon:yes gene_type:complete